MSSSNGYWLDQDSQLKIGKESVAYGEEIPDHIMKKIHPKTLDMLTADNKIGSMPKPGRVPGQAEFTRKIEEQEKIINSQKKQAAQAVGMREELDATKLKLGEIVKEKDGQMNGLKIENGGLREQIDEKDKEIKKLKETSADVEQLQTAMKTLAGTVDEKDAEIKTLTEKNKKANADNKKLEADLAKAKAG